MKLDVAVNEITLSNTGATGEFRIRNSAKAFKILSDGLYSNKIRAIIRELSCNAVDSHIAAGKADVPFEVHLPTVFEPWFAVRDFGVGLNDHQVTSIYTTYFESTKTESNDFIGALGLGSKSPFSYTENFSVTAIKDSVKRVYSAFINENGVPSIVEMDTEESSEPTGVEVKFSVTERRDYNSFMHEAAQVFRWFKLDPVITGVDSFTIEKPTYIEKDIVPGVHTVGGYHSGSMAVMGNIAYPLSKISEPEKYFGELAHLLECNLVLEFGIGELDFAASREELSYVPLTIASIKRKLEELNANLATHFSEQADAIENLWDRACFLYEKRSERLYRAAVDKYALDTNFPLYDVKSYYGKKEFKFVVTDLLTDQGLSIGQFYTKRGSVATNISASINFINNNHVPCRTISVDKDVYFVFNDLKTGCISRARYHFNTRSNRNSTVHCISHNSADPAEREAAYEKFKALLHNPPNILKASELDKLERAPTVSSQGIVRVGIKDKCRRGYSESYTWLPYTNELDPDVNYYYVALSGFQPLDKNGKELNFFAIREWMDNCGIPDIANIKILGVRKNRIKELEALDNWKWFEDKLMEETAKITDTQINSLVASGIFDAYYSKAYTNKNIAKIVGTDSPYAIFVNEYTNYKSVNGNSTALAKLCGKYGKAVQVDTITTKITKARDDLFKRYPLLKHLNTVPEGEVAEYIKLVDTQSKQEKN